MHKPDGSGIASRDPATDQRKYQRYAVGFPAFFGDGLTSQVGTVIDISREGCRMRCPETVAGPKYFHIEIHLAGPSETLAVDLAVMRWSRRGEIGIEFIRISPDHQERLLAIIQACERAAGV